MSRLDTARLVRAWPHSAAPPTDRAMALLVAMDGPAALSRTLGGHHHRLLEVQQALVGAPLEGVVACRRCGAENEFEVPAEAILALPVPPPHHTVQVVLGSRSVAARLPRMEDLQPTRGLPGPEAVRLLAARTCTPAPQDDDLDDASVTALAAAWDAADPAARVSVDLSCASCTRELRAVLDPVEFVVRALDRHVARVLADVHTIASAYGWPEETILSLPADRRRRYLELIGTRSSGATRPTLVPVPS